MGEIYFIYSLMLERKNVLYRFITFFPPIYILFDLKVSVVSQKLSCDDFDHFISSDLHQVSDRAVRKVRLESKKSEQISLYEFFLLKNYSIIVILHFKFILRFYLKLYLNLFIYRFILRYAYVILI